MNWLNAYRIPLDRWIENAVDWLIVHGEGVFEVIKWPVAAVLKAVVGALTSAPAPLVLAAFVAVGWLVGGWRIGLLAGAGLLLEALLGYWNDTMVTIGMIITAVAFCVVIGIPLGILGAERDSVNRVMRPVLDAMQTIHPFVFLVPIVMFFGIGQVPGTMATVIFALPPLVRLTNLGLREVSPEVIEGAKAFGASSMQLLLKVKLPLAWRTIMAGLNQTLMLALSMVVIVALIAGGGLGSVIFQAVGTLRVGQAGTAGLAVLIVAIVLDRISQVQRSGRPARQTS